MIKAVIFDVGDVLYKVNKRMYHSGLLKLFRSYGFKGKKDELQAELKNIKKVSLDKKLNTADLHKTFIKDLGMNCSDIKRLTEEWCDLRLKTRKMIPGVDSALKRLKVLGFILAVLSESRYESAEKARLLKYFKLAKYFEVIVSTRDTGMTKQYAEAYYYVLDKLKLSPKEAVFVGHKEHELVGAKAAGVRFISLNPELDSDYHIKKLSELPELITKINIRKGF